jgi:hypothetical protein
MNYITVKDLGGGILVISNARNLSKQIKQLAQMSIMGNVKMENENDK